MTIEELIEKGDCENVNCEECPCWENDKCKALKWFHNLDMKEISRLYLKELKGAKDETQM